MSIRPLLRAVDKPMSTPIQQPADSIDAIVARLKSRREEKARVDAQSETLAAEITAIKHEVVTAIGRLNLSVVGPAE